MKIASAKHWGSLLVLFLSLSFMGDIAHADPRDDFKDFLQSRQQAVADAFDKLHTRVQGMNSRDPKKEIAEDKLDTAEDKVDAFRDLDAGDHIEGDEPPFAADAAFLLSERQALEAINEVNRAVLSPARPGGEEGTVPEGTLLDDFIPQLVRLLFQFVSVAILIGIVVASVMMITAGDNEEHHTRAKKLFTYTFIGFAFVILAFALVKAITDIDFFAFV